MWFRNLQLFRIPAPVKLDLDNLAEVLAGQPLVPCGGLERARVGWVPVRGDGAFVYRQGEQLLLALGSEEKLLPSIIVKQAAAEKVAHLEEQEGYRLGGKRRREVRAQVEDELLPRAFARRSTLFAWIDPVGGWLGVDAASAAKAETFVKALGDRIPDLHVRLLHTQTSPAAAMTGWLADGDGPTGFSIDRDCELRLPGEDRATVRYVRHALDGAEIGDHIAAGKQATRLGLTWADRVSFVLTEKLELKRLAFLDVLKEQGEQAEDEDALFATEFTLMTGELRRLLDDLLEALGGEEAE